MDREDVGDAAADAAPVDRLGDIRPGDVLKRARESKGLSLQDVAEKTRIPMRQLDAVERNDFSALPGTPYAVGFARAYARAVDADEVAVAHGVRHELGMVDTSDRYEMFEPLDPARVPPRWLAWAAALIAVALAVGYAAWRAHVQVVPTDTELASRAVVAAPAAPSRPVAINPATLPVVLTATDAVWIRIYDQNGGKLLEKEMAKGESYTVPADAAGPMILTGRPDALAVTVGGKLVAPLGPPEKTVVDLPITATALLSRPTTATPAPAPATPSASAPAPRPPAATPASPPPAPAQNTTGAAD